MGGKNGRPSWFTERRSPRPQGDLLRSPYIGAEIPTDAVPQGRAVPGVSGPCSPTACGPRGWGGLPLSGVQRQEGAETSLLRAVQSTGKGRTREDRAGPVRSPGRVGGVCLPRAAGVLAVRLAGQGGSFPDPGVCCSPAHQGAPQPVSVTGATVVPPSSVVWPGPRQVLLRMAAVVVRGVIVISLRVGVF